MNHQYIQRGGGRISQGANQPGTGGESAMGANKPGGERARG